MTMALCFNCGEMKFGAFFPCEECQTNSSGKIHLGLTFSDHIFSISTLEQFGAVIKEIHAHCDDPNKSFYAFIHYISENYNAGFQVDLNADEKAQIMELLNSCTFPSIEIKYSADEKPDEMDDDFIDIPP